MNTRRIFSLILLVCVWLAGCAPAATATTPIAVAPQNTRPQATQAAAATRAPEVNRPPSGATKAPEATRAPAATSAPAAQGKPLPTASAPYYGPQATRAPQMPLDNKFQNYGTNPYIDTRSDHLSTFGLDVDTASYTVARKYLLEGNLPPQDAIRPEEFVNFFEAGYNPPAQAAFALYAEGAPSPFYNDGAYILRFGVQGYKIPESQRKPVALTFVIDISGSMNLDNRLGLVKRSLQVLVDRLRPQDTVGVVVFGTSARVALQPTAADRKDVIMNAINGLRTEGSTNAEAGLRLGYQQAMRSMRADATNKVILCSDGVANTGLTNPDAILEYIHGYIKEGITLNTYGFGMGNFNDVLLERLADRGDGMYAYIDSMEEAYRLFIDNLTGSLMTIAMDAKAQIDFNPAVVRYYRLIGYENRAVADQDFRNDTVDAGEIGAGHHVVALYAIYLQPGAQGRLATAQLRWLDPKTSQPTEINGNLNTWDLKADFRQTPAHYQLAVLAAQYAETLKGTPWAQEVSLWRVVDLAGSLREQLPFDQSVAEFADLVSRAARLLNGSRKN
jgi:Ca-activated chloride channel family protein